MKEASDRKYVAWIASLGCMVCHRKATVHHVRFCGSARDDRRVLPLCPLHHQIQWGPRSSIEALGKAKFEARYGVDIEYKVREYRERYLHGR